MLVAFSSVQLDDSSRITLPICSTTSLFSWEPPMRAVPRRTVAASMENRASANSLIHAFLPPGRHPPLPCRSSSRREKRPCHPPRDPAWSRASPSSSSWRALSGSLNSGCRRLVGPERMGLVAVDAAALDGTDPAAIMTVGSGERRAGRVRALHRGGRVGGKRGIGGGERGVETTPGILTVISGVCEPLLLPSLSFLSLLGFAATVNGRPGNGGGVGRGEVNRSAHLRSRLCFFDFAVSRSIHRFISLSLCTINVNLIRTRQAVYNFPFICTP